MMKIRQSLFALILVLLLCGANPFTQTKKVTDKLCFTKADKKTVCAEVSGEYPKTLEDKQYQFILNYFIQDLNTEYKYPAKKALFFQDFFQGFFKDYQDEFKENKQGIMDWAAEVKLEKHYQSNNTISFSSTIYVFTGGAHPNTYVSFGNFNLKKQQVLKLDDLFKGNYKPQLMRLAESYFRKSVNLSDEAPINSKGHMFDNDKFHLSQEFALDKKGLLLFYNPYEIAAYVMGPTELMIPRKDLVNLINPAAW